MATKDIYHRLRQDHVEMKSLMSKLSKKLDDELFSHLAHELKAHSTAEEGVLYSQLVEEELTHDLVLEGKAEHHVAALILRELKANRKDTAAWSAKLKVLQENVEHHIQEEEKKLFPKAHKILSGDTAKRMVQQFEQAKDLVAV
jgi:hemerythrin superfamily protein